MSNRATTTQLIPLLVAPSQVLRGENALSDAADAIARLGKRPLIVGGDRTLAATQFHLQPIFKQQKLSAAQANYSPDCSETSLASLREAVKNHQADLIIGVGGGKALDTAKLLAHQCQLPIVTIPTSGATCAAWTALSNIYSNEGAFQYDVGLNRCPDLLILDYELIKTASPRTLVAGIGDAIANGMKPPLVAALQRLPSLLLRYNKPEFYAIFSSKNQPLPYKRQAAKHGETL